MDSVLLAFAVSFGVIFVAELGDKSQLMALTFATRYKTLPVLVGITIATSVVHLISVAVGYGLGAALPTDWISLVAAVAFLGFGAWSLRGDSLTEEEQGKAARAGGSAVVAASVAFFLAELGDKTMLATITLATTHGWFGVWVGSTLGMVAADALAILAGRKLGRYLPERVVRIGSAVLFFVFGIWLATDALGQLAGTTFLALVGDAVDHHAAGWIALGIGGAAVLLGGFGRLMLSAVGRDKQATSPAAWVARGLFVLSLLLGFAAPVLVALDVIEPIAVFAAPAGVVVGAGLALLGVTLLLASQLELAAVRSRGEGLPLVTRGLHGRIRNPGLTGLVIATAGTLVMVPTLIAVLAAVLAVVAVQVQARAIREPRLAVLYGPSYAEYVARTGRFLPRVTRDDTPPGMPSREHQRVG
jgi:Ca2+/H+ antiporter, TMEM165/GDT1 family